MGMVLGTWYVYLLERKSLDVIESLQSKLIWMVQLLDWKHDLWLKGTLRPMVWTILIPFPPLLR